MIVCLLDRVSVSRARILKPNLFDFRAILSLHLAFSPRKAHIFLFSVPFRLPRSFHSENLRQVSAEYSFLYRWELRRKCRQLAILSCWTGAAWYIEIIHCSLNQDHHGGWWVKAKWDKPSSLALLRITRNCHSSSLKKKKKKVTWLLIFKDRQLNKECKWTESKEGRQPLTAQLLLRNTWDGILCWHACWWWLVMRGLHLPLFHPLPCCRDGDLASLAGLPPLAHSMWHSRLPRCPISTRQHLCCCARSEWGTKSKILLGPPGSVGISSCSSHFFNSSLMWIAQESPNNNRFLFINASES